MKKAVKIVLILIVLGLLAFAAALGVLTYMEKHPPERMARTDALIVLGAQVRSNGELSVQLEWRLQAALDSYREQPRLIITCGAQGKDEPCAEGDAMRAWLIRQGVAETDVIAETGSTDTRENIRNATALLPEGAQTVTVVTSDYHLPRALALARDAGLQADGIGSPCKAEYWAKNHFREVLGWGKYFLYKIVR